MGLRLHYNIILKLGKFKAPFVAVSMEFQTIRESVSKGEHTEGLFNAAVCVYSGGLFELVVYLGLLALVFIGFHR